MYIHRQESQIHCSYCARWPISSFLEKLPCIEMDSARERLQELVEAAKAQYGDEDVFIDPSTSADWKMESAVDMSTCLRPSHHVFSVAWTSLDIFSACILTYIHTYIHTTKQLASEVKRSRFLTPREHLALQGFWPWTYGGKSHVAALEMTQHAKAKHCAGNAFSTTVAMAALIASLVTCSGWFSIAQRHKIVEPQLALEDEVEDEIEDEVEDEIEDEIEDEVEDEIEDEVAEEDGQEEAGSSFVSFGSLDKASKLRRLSSDEISAKVPVKQAQELKAHDPLEDMLDGFERQFEEDEVREKRRQIRQRPKIAQALGVDILRPEALQFNPNRILQDPGQPAPEPEAVSVLPEAPAADNGLAVLVPKRPGESAGGDARPTKRRLRGKQADSAYDQIVEQEDNIETMDQENHKDKAKPVKKQGRKRKNPADPDEDPQEIVEKTEDKRGQNKRGDSISIAKKLEYCKQYEALVEEHGKKVGAQQFYALKLPGDHCMHTYIHTYIHTNIHTYIHTYIGTYIHTYIHMYVHTYMENQEWRIQSKNVIFESFSNRN